MFTSARIKLTAWYLLIISIISIAFSLFIYRVLSVEIYRFARSQRFRIERRFFDTNMTPAPTDIELIEETKHRLFLTLTTINLSIIAISGTLGYFLAGRTLDPIQQMVEEQNRFISDSSHELRTPLTALKSSMEVNLRDKKMSLKDARKLMVENIKEVDSLQSLSDNLLKLTQYQSPQNHLNIESVDLAQLTAQAISKVDPMLKKKNITISNSVKKTQIKGDRHGLVDLLVILLDNAIKYSPNSSKISISTKITNKSVCISVKDRGIGIDKKDIPNIFDRFYRSDISRSKTDTDGFGLGLSIAKKITDNHHGKLTVTSTPSKGSVFSVTLPV